MLDRQIVELRDELHNMISRDTDNKEIYAVSVQLDKLIVEYYKRIGQTKIFNKGTTNQL